MKSKIWGVRHAESLARPFLSSRFISLLDRLRERGTASSLLRDCLLGKKHVHVTCIALSLRASFRVARSATIRTNRLTLETSAFRNSLRWLIYLYQLRVDNQHSILKTVDFRRILRHATCLCIHF